MKKLYNCLIFLIVSVLIVGCNDGNFPVSSSNDLATTSEINLSKRGNIQHVSGHVEVPVGGIIEKYSFTATRHGDGSVTGEWQVKDKFFPGKGGNFTVHGNVTCFSIQPDGKTVYLGGVIEKNDFGFDEGSEANWTVIDNGEGKNAASDMATDLTFGFDPGSGAAAYHCATGDGITNIPPTPIVGGNIQVKS